MTLCVFVYVCLLCVLKKKMMWMRMMMMVLLLMMMMMMMPVVWRTWRWGWEGAICSKMFA